MDMQQERMKVVVIVGSLRKESWTRKLARAMVPLAPAWMDFEFVEYAALPLYNEDDEGDPVASVVQFRKQVAAADAVLFATPEYNRSMPGGLKNALDVGSRPYGKSVWDGKPCAVVSVSPGAMGGFGAHHALRQCLVFLNMPTLQQPEMYIGNVARVLTDTGVVPTSIGYFQQFMARFGEWALRQRKAAPGSST